MMDAIQIEPKGHLCWWKTLPTPHKDLARELVGTGVECPAPNTQQVALRLAVAEYAKETRQKNPMVQRLKHRGSAELREVQRGENENDYECKLTAKVNDRDEVELLQYDYIAQGRINELYRKHRALVGGGAISAMLKNKLYDLLGTTVRDAGGTYYLPPNGWVLDQWLQVTQAIERANGGVVTTAAVLLGDSVVAAIADGLTNEILQAAEEVEGRLVEAGEEALTNMEHSLLILEAKMNRYQSILERPLASCKGAIDKAQAAIGGARLVSAALA